MEQGKCIENFLDHRYENDFRYDSCCQRWLAGYKKSYPLHNHYYEIFYTSDDSCSLPVLHVLETWFSLPPSVLRKIFYKWLKNKIKNSNEPH